MFFGCSLNDDILKIPIIRQIFHQTYAQRRTLEILDSKGQNSRSCHSGKLLWWWEFTFVVNQ